MSEHQLKHREPSRRWGFRFAGLVLASGALLLPLAAPALAAGGTVTGTGGCLNERTAAGISSPSIACMPDGTAVNVICQYDFGPDDPNYAVNGHWGRTSIWDFIDANGGGWVSDGFVDTGSNSFVAPSCW